MDGMIRKCTHGNVWNLCSRMREYLCNPCSRNEGVICNQCVKSEGDYVCHLCLV